MKKLMKTGLFCLLGVILLLGYANQVQAAEKTITVTLQGKIYYNYANSVLKLVNKERKKVNAAPLTLDKELTDAAVLRAVEISVCLDHTRPDGTSCFTANDNMSGENIAAGSMTPEGVMSAWMHSPGHKANILNKSYKSIGIGCFKNGPFFWTQCFSSKASKDVAVYKGIKQSNKKITVLRSKAKLFTITEVLTRGYPKIYLVPGEKSHFVCGLMEMGRGSGYALISTDDIVFTSSDPSIIRVNADGTFEALKVGKAKLTAALKQAPEVQSTETISCRKAGAADIAKGRTYLVKGIIYKITNAATNGSGTVSVTGTTTAKDKLTTLTIPSTVKIGGKTFQVTRIAAKACKGYTSLTKVTIGNKVKEIGKEAFSGCSSLNTITIKTSKLTSVGTKTIQGINENATIKVPAKKVKTYKKLFTGNTGYVNTMKINA